MSRLAARHGFRVCLAAAALALGGCALLLDPTTPQVENRCDGADDCGAGSTCDTTHRMCVASSAPSYEVRVEVAPARDPLRGVPVPMLFDLGRLGGVAELVGPVQVPVQGTARFDGEPISAQITFTRRSQGADEVLSGALALPVAVRASSATSEEVDFVARLPAGTTYDVYVEPQSDFRALLPPLWATLEVPEGAGVSFAVAYSSDELVEVTGVVLDADRAAQPGLLVRAVDPSSGRTLSSATSTDDDGRFTLVLPQGASGFAFQVRGDATRQDSSALFPNITIDAGSLMPGSDGSFTLLVPASDRALRLEGRVELPATLGVNVPAREAHVHLASPYVSDPETGLVGSLELDLTTDAEGRFVGFVLPGEYRVEIISSDEDVGVLVDTLEVLANPTSMILGQLFTLPERSILGGTVQLADGEPVTGSRVRASPLGLDLEGEIAGAARLNRGADGLTGSMGEFRLPLDVGVYDLVVEMPADSGFAWHVERDFGVGGTGVPLRRVMSVRAPFRLAGSARFAEGTPLSGAGVRLYAIDPVSGRAVEVGATDCDENGEFVALLPPELE